MKFAKLIFVLFSFGFTPIRYASQDGHWYELFKANVQHVLGEHPAHSVIAHLARPEAGGGEGVWLDGIDALASEDATHGVDLTGAEPTGSAGLATPKKFSQMSSGDDFAAYQTTLTPFNDVVKLKTFSAPEINEWGHSFQASEDTWQNLTDPKSTVISVGMQKMHLLRDIMFAKAVTAASVMRRIDGGTLGAVSLPSTQEITGLVKGTVSVDNLPAHIREIMGDAWFTKGMPLYCAISTTVARALKANSGVAGGDMLRSRDFVSSYENFKSGDLPQVEGVTFIEMPKPFMDSVKTSVDDHFFAWTPQAIASVNYQGLGTQIGIDPNRRFYTSAYVSEFIDFKRTDDRGVVVGTIADA